MAKNYTNECIILDFITAGLSPLCTLILTRRQITEPNYKWATFRKHLKHKISKNYQVKFHRLRDLLYDTVKLKYIAVTKKLTNELFLGA